MLVKESIFRDLSRLLVWYPLRWMIRVLSVTAAFQLFRIMGDLHLWAFRSRLSDLATNLKRGLHSVRPEMIPGLLCTYLRNHYVDRLHIFTYPKLRWRSNLDRVASLSGLEHLDTALEKGRGVIIALGHYGPIQLPLFVLGVRQYRITQVGLPTDKGLSWIGRNVAFRLRMKYEAMIPARILPADKFLRPLFQTLKQNGIVFMTIDPAGGGQWIGKLIRLPFLGEMVPFPVGAASLSIKTGAPILPLAITRNSGGYNCAIKPPVHPGGKGLEATEITAYLVRWYEDMLFKDPGLWHFWDEFQPGKLLEEKPEEDSELP
jgi:phosphatidylinositol dimannoside acyltransferase